MTIAEGIYLLDSEALGFRETVAAYLIKGDRTALVDTGYASSAEVILEKLRELGIKPGDLNYIVLTHIHLDHAGGAGKLIRDMPKAMVIVHEKGAKHLADPTRLVESTKSIFGPDQVRLFGEVIPIEPSRIISVGEEADLDLGEGYHLRIFWAPGHAPHHICILEENENVLFTGDAVCLRYPRFPVIFPTTPPPSFDPDLALSTLERISQIRPHLLLTPHFGKLEFSANLIEINKRKIGLWMTAVESLLSGGLDDQQVMEALTDMLATEAGIARNSIPPYALSSIRTTALGILHYLRRKRFKKE